jgi:hypothetical protein
MMPLIPIADFERAKKRMRLGLHPAVLAAVEKSVLQRPGAPNAGLRPRANVGVVSLGTGTNPGHSRPVPPGGDMRAAMDPLAGQQYRTYLQGNAETGGLREVHVYGSGANRQVRSFNRQSTPELQARIGSTLQQQLSNTATAHDKLLAMAVRQAAAGSLSRAPFQTHRFSRKPGLMQRY